jgi:hypothetical protein
MKTLFFFIFYFFIVKTNAQDSTKVKFSAYSEVYYSYDFAKPSTHQKPAFTYNHKRHNEVALNLAILKANYENSKIRGNVAAMFGNYPQNNLAAEPSLLQNIYEANIGVNLAKKNNIWLDAGVMSSHIGFESAISQDCWTLTRSLLAENSPYFETGAKLSASNDAGNFNAALLLLNGWQRIQRVDGNQRIAFGAQLNYKPSSTLTLNYSNFVGSDQPDSANILRTYHNFYAIYEPNEKIGLILGFDVGTEDRKTWYSPVAILRKKVSEKSKVALRYELFSDREKVLVSTNNSDGFQVSGISLNYDFAIAPNCMFRIEGKNYFSKYDYFSGKNSKNNFSFTTSLSLKL